MLASDNPSPGYKKKELVSGKGFFKLAAIIVSILLIYNPFTSYSQNGDCDPTVPTYVVDLTSDANGVWSSTTNFQPLGQCCNVPAGHNCFEFLIYLHPSATSVSFEILQGPTGGLYYQIDCSPSVNFPNNPKKICLLGKGPHRITFCRNGTPPPFEVEIISNNTLDVSVTLNPFSDVCVDASSFPLSGGSPLGGAYYVNGVAATNFNPAFWGPGEHLVRYIYNHPSGCSGFADQIITVHALPEVTFTPPLGCLNNGNIVLSGGLPAGGVYSGSYIADGVFQTLAAGPGAHAITYTYVDPYGCSAAVSDNIIVYPNPTANAGADQTIAANTTANLNASSGGSGTYSYQWSPASLVVNPNVQNTTTLPLTQSTVFILTVTDLTTGCVSTDQKIVTVTGGALSIAQISPPPSTICSGEEIHLWVLASGGTGNYNYNWASNPPGFTSNLQNPLASPVVNTTYSVTVTDGANSVVGNTQITVHPLPLVTLPPQGSVCANTQGFSFTGGSPAGGYYMASGITFAQGQQFSPHILGEGSVNVYYYYTDANGCVGTGQNTLLVLPFVKSSFDMAADLCIPNRVTFRNKSIGGTSFEWFFGDGQTSTSTDLQFVHDYPPATTPQTYTATLIARNAEGCFNVFSQQITIGPPIQSNFTASPLSGCAPLEVDFTHQMSGPIALFLWNFGDYNFSVQPNPTHTFNNFGSNDTTYRVSLTVVSNNFFCVETHEVDILVHPYIKAGLTVTPVEHCNPYPAAFSNTSIGADNSIWDFGDGNTFTGNDPVVNHLFENYGSAPITYDVNLLVSNEEGCTDTVNRPITVFPHIEADFTASVIEGCAPLEVHFTDASIGVTLYKYDFGDGAILFESNPVHVFQNQTDATITYTVELTVTNDNLCEDVKTIDIIVKPEVRAGFVFNPAFACNPFEVEITNTSMGASIFNWDFGDGTTGTNSDPVFTHHYEHNSPNPVTYQVVLEVENPQGCQSNITRELVVYPKVDANFEVSIQQGCNPLTVTFENRSAGAATFHWDFGDGGSSVEFEPQHTFVNTNYLHPDTFTVTLTSVSQWLCEDQHTFQIIVYPAILPAFGLDEPSGCSPHTVEFTNNAQGGLNYFWDFGDGTLYSGNDPQLSHEFINSGAEPQTFVVNLRVENSHLCSAEDTSHILVFPEVHASFNYIDEGCHPLEMTFENTSLHAHTYLWEFGDGYTSELMNPLHTFFNFSHTSPVEMFISLFAKSVYGCTDMIFHSVEVFPKPDASFVITNSPGCSPHEIILLNLSEGAQNFSWDFGDGTTSASSNATITHLYNHEPGSGPAIFDIELMVDNSYNCLDTLVHQAIIYPNITSAFQANILEGCHPLSVDFSNLSVGATANTPYLWNYGDGNSSVSQQALHTHVFNNFDPEQTVVYSVRLVAVSENECTDTSWVSITVFPRAQPAFNILNSPGCSPHIVEFENISQGGTTYLWDFGDGDTSTESNTLVNHLYQVPPSDTPGIFPVVLWSNNQFDCEQTFTQNVTIYPDIFADISVVEQGCHPFTTAFSDVGAGGSTYYWDFGDGNQTLAPQPQHTFFNYNPLETAEFTVALTATSAFSCIAYDTVTITVNPKPVAAFQLASTSGCSPFITQINNQSTGSSANFWDFSNGTAQNNEVSFSHTWINNGASLYSYQVELIAENDYLCSDTTSINILVYPHVHADFTTSDGLFAGCSPYEVNFVNQTYLGNTYKWDFGDGGSSLASSPYHIFVNNTVEDVVFPVEMIATSIFTCTDTISKDITVYPAPLPNFSASPEWQVYPSATVTLYNNTNPGYWDFIWEYGDGNDFETQSFDPHNHTYIWDGSDLTTKTYLISLFASSDRCSAIAYRQVTITSPRPEAIFEPATQGCQPFKVEFVNHSLHGYHYAWDFADGSVSFDTHPTHIFYDHGEHQVRLIVTGDGGVDTTYRLVTVHELPKAKFRVEPNLIEIPHQTLTVINESYNSDFFWWHFGDGNTSEEFEPAYLYIKPGIYDITLIVGTDTEPRCYDTLVYENAVRVDESCRIIFPNAFIPSVAGPNGGAYDINNPNNQVFYPLHEGVEKYRLEIYTRWGELIFVSEDVAIGWDGYYRNRLAKQDVYVWKVTGICTNGREFSYVGDVTLFR